MTWQITCSVLLVLLFVAARIEVHRISVAVDKLNNPER